MTYHYDWRWSLPATPEALWPFVSNTNHFNRAAGVPHVERIGAGGANGRQRLQLKRFGVVVQWIEEPFEWERPRRFSVRRLYERGPVAEMRVQVDLEPVSAGTALRYQVWAQPRNTLGRAAIPFQIGLLSQRKFKEVLDEYAHQARSQPATMRSASMLEVELLREAQLATGADQRVAAIRERLQRDGHNVQLAENLIRFITYADALSLARVRPYLLADAWGAPRRATVELCLSATRAGLLDLQWDVMCPLCRGAKDTVDSMRDLPQSVHCDACNIDFSANFEQQVELTFRPTPAIRSIEVYPFCVGGPQVTPHIVVQQLLPPQSERVAAPDLEPGRYRIRASNAAGGQLIEVVTDAAQRLVLRVDAAGWPATIAQAGSSAQLVLQNETDSEQLIIIERVAWTDLALTAAEVTALQRFRDLFSAEALRPGETVSVGSLAVLFTDLRNSTRLYREIGDASAFGRVLDHFDVLRGALEPEEGALVKTIGDAVMAVFRRPAGAIRAILRAQDALAHGPEGVQPPFLKAGAHFGPCIGVTLNDRLDYFGSTVNIAARINGQSRGGEIVVSDPVRFDPEVEAMIKNGLISAERFEVQLKGFEDMPFSLWRITAADGRFGQC